MKKFLVSLFLMSNMAWGADWYEIRTTDTSKDVSFVDLSSVKYGNGYLNVVIKREFTPKSDEFGKRGIKETRTLFHISCNDNSYNIKSHLSYGKSGNVIDSLNFPNKPISQFEYAFPDTVVGNVVRMACDYHETGSPEGQVVNGVPIRLSGVFLTEEEKERSIPNYKHCKTLYPNATNNEMRDKFNECLGFKKY